jgi:hypothetical protein
LLSRFSRFLIPDMVWSELEFWRFPSVRVSSFSQLNKEKNKKMRHIHSSVYLLHSAGL